MLFFVICAAFALFPDKVISGAASGAALCINAVIPSLLPFMLVSSCLIKSGFSRPLGSILSKIISPFTGLGSSGCVCLLTGLIGGYGAGARAVFDSFAEGRISKAEAERLLAFCNNAGPLFVIGTVGIGFFSDVRAGAVLYIMLVISSIICAAAGGGEGECKALRSEWEFYRKNKPPAGRLISDCAVSSACAMGTVCVFVITFSAIINLLPTDNAVLAGIIEVTCGLRGLSRGGASALPAAAALLSWGGLSVHFQASALCGGKFSMKKYYIGRVFMAIVSFSLMYIYCCDTYVFALVLTVIAAALICKGIIGVYRAQPRPRAARQRQRS